MATTTSWRTQHPFDTDLDISSTAFWAKRFAERDETFRSLRLHAPVSWHAPMESPGLPPEIHGEAGFWAVVKHEDIGFVSQNHKLFSSDGERWGGVIPAPMDPRNASKPTFISMDPPDQTRHRKIMSSAFTPKAVGRLADKINERAEQIVSRVVGAGDFDFVTEVSEKLPMLTVADMVGVPESLVTTFAAAGNAIAGVQDSEFRSEDTSVVEHYMKQFMILREIGTDLVRYRRDNPAEDIATALAFAEFDGRRLDDDDIQATMVLLSVAGNDTTKQTTSHTVTSLWQNPDQKAWLAEDFDGRIAGAVEEFIRHASPVIAFARTATEDLQLGGKDITQGDKLVMFYCSGNRDEQAFEDPHRFDLARTPNTHVGFGGGGVHYCLGNGVAKVQLRAIFRRVLDKLPHMEVGEPVPLNSAAFHGVKHLPVRA
ncbi:cytochrome P450 [Streptomyces sp. CA-100214]